MAARDPMRARVRAEAQTLGRTANGLTREIRGTTATGSQLVGMHNRAADAHMAAAGRFRSAGLEAQANRHSDLSVAHIDQRRELMGQKPLYNVGSGLSKANVAPRATRTAGSPAASSGSGS